MNTRLLSIGFLALALNGCGVKPPITGQADPYPRSQIMYASRDLKDRTAVGTPVTVRDAAGLLFVTVPIRAASKYDLYVDYRATFFDSTGGVIQQTGWYTKNLDSNVPDQITVNSTTPRATDFQIDFRYSR